MEVDLVREGDIAIITINRPDKLNALNTSVIALLKDAINSVLTEHVSRAVIITGSGTKAFAAGADVAEMVEMGASEALEFSKLGHQTLREIEKCQKPVIAAVNGYALGGGLELTLSCDILHAPGNQNPRFAKHNRLSSQDNGLKSRTTYLINR